MSSSFKSYTPIGAASNWSSVPTRFVASTASSKVAASRNDLWNGNIGTMMTTLLPTYDYAGASTAADVPAALPLASGYLYDQLNRIKKSNSYTDITSNVWASTGTSKYYTRYTFDKNGNIDTLIRKDQNGDYIDSLRYWYYDDATAGRQQNRLYHVNDIIGVSVNTVDVDDQGSPTTTVAQSNEKDNYSYDEIGNLKKDSAEQIRSITWTVSGKIKKIIRYGSSIKDDLEFMYDASGNRIAKIVKPDGSSADNGSDDPTQWKYTYYVRDPQGNIMAVYDKRTISSATHLKLKERDIYGSSRLGVDNTEIDLTTTPSEDDVYTNYLGNKNYELVNHLGNVNAVVSDIPIPRDDDADQQTDFYMPDIVTAQDYYPFGMLMPGRNFTASEAIKILKINKLLSSGQSYTANINGSPVTLATYHGGYTITDYYNDIITSLGGVSITGMIEDDHLKITGWGISDRITTDDEYVWLTSQKNYRFGFNGKEGDDEVKGEGDQQDYGMRIYDTRISRFLSIDPLFSSYPWYSPYQFSGNKPIWAKDLDGQEEFKVTYYVNQDVSYASTKVELTDECKPFNVIYETKLVTNNRTINGPVNKGEQFHTGNEVKAAFDCLQKREEFNKRGGWEKKGNGVVTGFTFIETESPILPASNPITEKKSITEKVPKTKVKAGETTNFATGFTPFKSWDSKTLTSAGKDLANEIINNYKNSNATELTINATIFDAIGNAHAFGTKVANFIDDDGTLINSTTNNLSLAEGCQKQLNTIGNMVQKATGIKVNVSNINITTNSGSAGVEAKVKKAK